MGAWSAFAAARTTASTAVAWTPRTPTGGGRSGRPIGSRGRSCASTASSSRPTGTPRWAASSSARARCGSARRMGAIRLLHERPTAARGVLHAGGHRQGGARHATHGRQHAAVHGDGCGRAEGELRHRRPARLLRGRRSLRRDRAVRSQRRRDAGHAVVADARPPAWRRPTADALRRPAADPGGARGGRPPRAAQRDERRAHERAAGADRRQRAGSTRRGSPSTRSASTSCAPPCAATRRAAWPRSATSSRPGCARPPSCSARASGCCRRCCRASISQTRRRRRPVRSTTFTCCAG